MIRTAVCCFVLTPSSFLSDAVHGRAGDGQNLRHRSVARRRQGNTTRIIIDCNTTARSRKGCRRGCHRERSPPNPPTMTGSATAWSETCWEFIA